MLPLDLRPTARQLVWAGGLWLAAAGAADAQPPTLPAPQPAPAVVVPGPVVVSPAPVITRYTLGDALAIARAQHPQLAAMRASMNAALFKHRGVDEVKRMAGIITPDIDYRVQQSDLGLRAAMAEYAQAEHEVTYAVVRCYYTVVYAREQIRVAHDLVEQLETNLEQVRKIVEGKAPVVRGITKNTEDRLEVFLGQAKTRQNQAEIGIHRARAVLREAMGLEPGCRVDAADEWLPEIVADLDRDTIIAHAVTRRGEVTLARIGADVTRLEACAQWAKRFNLTADTFARGADIHARPIPAAERDPDYRPGAIGPEMPTQLVGKRETRRATAEVYATRAEAAAAQARSLVGLEAENAFYRYQEAARNVTVNRRAATKARELTAREREAAGGIATREDTLQNELSASLALKTLNDALYDQIVALANLERTTAGGVRVNFPGR
jgi:outer membrane protein TolC